MRSKLCGIGPAEIERSTPVKKRRNRHDYAIAKPFISGIRATTQERYTRQAFPKIRIKHPFLKAVCNGTATMDQIRAWAIQDYQFRAAVPRIAMLRYLACTDPEIAQKLWGVVEEETRGMDTGSAGHNELAIRFAESIGLTKNSLRMPSSVPPPRHTCIMSS